MLITTAPSDRSGKKSSLRIYMFCQQRGKRGGAGVLGVALRLGEGIVPSPAVSLVLVEAGGKGG